MNKLVFLIFIKKLITLINILIKQIFWKAIPNFSVIIFCLNFNCWIVFSWINESCLYSSTENWYSSFWCIFRSFIEFNSWLVLLWSFSKNLIFDCNSLIHNSSSILLVSIEVNIRNYTEVAYWCFRKGRGKHARFYEVLFKNL